MRQSQAVTLHDVAAAAGISHMTVHRALMGSELVKPETRARVQAVADRLGYRPNLTARAMRNRTASRVGLLSSTNWGRTHLTVGMLVGMHDTLHQHGVSLGLMRLTDAELLDQDHIGQQVRSAGGDGLIVAYESHQPHALMDVLRELRVPTIWYNVKRDADCVFNDDQRTGREAAERALALGHRRLLYYCQSYEPDDAAEHYSSTDRCAGVAAACAAHGAHLTVRRGRRLTPQRAAFAQEALTASQATAVICYSASAAWVVLQAALALGRRVPEDVSLVSCDGDWGPYQERELAHFTPDFQQMGAMAATALMERIAQPRIAVPPRACPALSPVLAGAGCGTLAAPI